MPKRDPLGYTTCPGPGCSERVLVTETTKGTGFVRCPECTFTGFINDRSQLENLEPYEGETADEPAEEPEEGPAEEPAGVGDGDEGDGDAGADTGGGSWLDGW